MGPVEFGGGGRTAVAGITARLRAGTGNRRNCARLGVDLADRLIFGIHDVNMAVRADSNAFGTTKSCLFRLPTVARESLLSRSSNVVQNAVASAGQRQPPDTVAFAESNPKVVAANAQSSRANHRFTPHWLTVTRQLFPAVSGHRDNDSRTKINATNAVIADVGNIQLAAITRFEQRDAVGLSQFGLCCRMAVTPPAGFARASDGADSSGLRIDAADKVIFHFDEIHVAVTIKPHFVRFVELCGQRRPAIAAVAAHAGPGYRRKLLGREIEFSYTVICHFANVEPAVGTNFDTERLPDPRRIAVAGNCVDGPAGRGQQWDHQKSRRKTEAIFYHCARLIELTRRFIHTPMWLYYSPRQLSFHVMNNSILQHLVLALLISSAGPLFAEEAPSDAATEAFFEKRIRPLLARHCFECHAGDDVESGLRLDSLAGMLAGGERGPAIIAGKPKESLVRAVNHGEQLQMPPKKKLAAAAV